MNGATLDNYFDHQVAAIYTPLKDEEFEKLILKSRKVMELN